QDVPDRSVRVHPGIHDVAAKDQGQPPVEQQPYAPSPTGHKHGEHNQAPAKPREEPTSGNALHMRNRGMMAQRARFAKSVEGIRLEWLVRGSAKDIHANVGARFLGIVGQRRTRASVRMWNSSTVAPSPDVRREGHAAELVGYQP